MDAIEFYLHRVQKSIGLPRIQSQPMIDELRDHLQLAIDGGASPREAIRNMGDPRELAAELMHDRPLNYAGALVRTVAFFIDFLLMMIVTAPFYFFPMLFVYPGIPLTRWFVHPGVVPQSDFMTLGLVISFVVVGTWTVAVYLLYFPLFEYLYGGTPGKKLFRLRVVQEDGTAVKAGAAFIRRLSVYFDILFLDALFIFFSDRKQRAFDKVADTVVVHDSV
jgi:uncharacterized RDD family membrane protein YckC